MVKRKKSKKENVHTNTLHIKQKIKKRECPLKKMGGGCNSSDFTGDNRRLNAK